MRWHAGGLVGLLLLAGAAGAAESAGTYVLTPPRAAAAREALWVRVTVGVLPRGALMRVTTHDGRLIGTISPFGTAPGQGPQTYTLALPNDAAAGGAIRLRIEIRPRGGAWRAPTPDEVLSVTPAYVPVSN